MTTTQLRRKIKQAIDRVPVDSLSVLADYVAALNRQPLAKRIAAAEKAIKAGKVVNWRKVRNDV